VCLLSALLFTQTPTQGLGDFSGVSVKAAPCPPLDNFRVMVICLEVKRGYCQNCSVLGCVTQCSQSAALSYEEFLQVQQIGFVTLGPLRHA